MKKYFAIVLYRCYIESVYTGDIDYSCRYYEKESADEVRTAIQQDEEHEYKNSDGEQVKWVLDEIIQIDEVEKLSSEDEVVGFICNEGEFIKRTPENLIENIRLQYESEKSESIPVTQVQNDISVLVNEIARLKAFFNLT